MKKSNLATLASDTSLWCHVRINLEIKNLLGLELNIVDSSQIEIYCEKD